ncbi:hypothetical protein DICPUDRAFT_81704, partial [Dictyostelium purpureum]
MDINTIINNKDFNQLKLLLLNDFSLYKKISPKSFKILFDIKNNNDKSKELYHITIKILSITLKENCIHLLFPQEKILIFNELFDFITNESYIIDLRVYCLQIIPMIFKKKKEYIGLVKDIIYTCFKNENGKPIRTNIINLILNKDNFLVNEHGYYNPNWDSFYFLDFFLSSVLKEYFLNLSEDDQDNGEYDTLVEYLNKILEYLIKLYKGNKSEIIDSNSYLNSIKSILNFIVFLKTSKRIDNIKKNIIELLSTIVRESDEISDIYILNIFMDFKRILGNDLNTFFEEHYLILKEQKMKTSSTESPIIIIYLGFFKNKGPYYFLRDLYYNFIEEFLEIFLSKDDFKNIHFIIEIVSPLPSKEIAQKYFLLLLDLVNKKEKILNIDYFKCLNIFLDNNKLQLDKSILNDHQFQLNILKRMDYFLEEKNDELCEIISKKLGEYMPVLHYKYISLVIIDKPPINSSSKNYDLFLHPIVNILENDYDYFNEFLTHKQCHSFISNLKKVLFLSSCSVKLINLFFASQLCKNKSILSTEKKSLATTYIESFQKDFERHFNSLILINKPMNREFIVGFLTLTFLIYNLIKIIPENNLSLPYVKEITQILSPFQ